MNIKPITLDEWMESVLMKELQLKPPNSFTIYEAMAKTGMKRETMYKRLNRMVEDGLLKKGTFIEGGKIKIYYLPVDLDKNKKDGNKKSKNS